ncbi:PucR family transcriptional regulator [Actinokineospora xionganensis]|uniref:PucR family transcriptional regulator ligand-binding domain-containing protein n=1 Tax=Actinokineospora xionganensis TaxID=2684470 RepID=A0ABR7LAC4_9PSEU|nr:PucR family transcriptional regulator ligand-binding domain-containing protein [Actinokineospora xionganensis]MBC6449517.1 PucR family transcriptional regulator ligand-binding domain-containing protein [Actinokineospora xionganensis]
MYPTVSEILALPVMRQGAPTVVAGASGLSHRVRWVHAAEVADIAHLLRGGELVLTTGIALPDDPDALTRYVDELAGIGAAGIVVELVRHWSHALPPALSAAAERHRLPLITLSRETRFVAVTEAVVGLIVDAQVAELRTAEQVHETFTALTVAGAEPAEVLREVTRASGLPVVLETLAHDVLAYDAGGESPGELLADWARRSRAVTVSERTAYHDAAGWLVTVVGARGNDWGRLVLLCPEPPAHHHIVIVERAASALAVHRLAARDREGLERHAHRTLLTELLAAPTPPPDLVARATGLGVPLENRQLIGVSVRPGTEVTPAPAMATQEVLRDLAEATSLATRRARVAALVGIVDDTSVRALLSLTPQADTQSVLRRLAKEIHQSPRAIILAVGTTVDAISQARRSLVEAAHVAQAALRAPGTKPFHRLDDVRLRGLLHLLADDDRVTAFADRELAALMARDTAHGSRLLDTLRHYCELGGNKSAAASAAHMSRTAYYQQLARIEQILGVSLDDPESVLSLHVALLALDVRNSG